MKTRMAFLESHTLIPLFFSLILQYVYSVKAISAKAHHSTPIKAPQMRLADKA